MHRSILPVIDRDEKNSLYGLWRSRSGTAALEIRIRARWQWVV